MESFEMPDTGYNINSTPTPTPERPHQPSEPQISPQQTVDIKPKAKTASNKQPEVKKNNPPRKNPAESTSERIATFLGIVIFILAAYFFVAAIGFISSGAADQSIVENKSFTEIAQNTNQISNTAGKFGAYFSNFVISKWIGLSAFILILYLGVIGLSLIRITHVKVKFWKFTFKTFVSVIALSILLGGLTYTSPSPIFWGGLHGHLVIQFLYTYTGIWGCIGVCIIMASALILIFISPIAKICRTISALSTKIRNKVRSRYKASMEAGKATISHEETTPPAHTDVAAAQDQISLPSQEINIENPEDTPAEINLELTDIEALTSTEENNIESPDALNFDITPYTNKADDYSNQSTVSSVSTTSNDFEPTDTPTIIQNETQATSSPKEELVIDTPEIEQADTIDVNVYDPTADLSRYHLPSISLLREYPDKGAIIDEAEQEENKQTIINTLRTYGVEIASIKATVGPTITLYEIIPAEGVRIATIKRLGDDMTLSLSAIGIRIIAPIPGKGTIGMEVPNKKKQIVSIRDILSSKAYQDSNYELPMALGTTISNEVFITDLAKMPHLLVAGATGMGKSVGLNTIIASLLYKKHPAELKMVLIDPKMVEFSLYKCLEKHFLAKLPEEENAIITDPNKVVATLNSLCLEMDNRYALLSDAELRNIKEYNQKFISRRLNPLKGHRYLPYIVVIIDEFADLIITAGKEVETPIARIAAKARAVGIHMILATQRPSVNVITGVIKANFPGRMAFRVTQMNDSRTILDRPGAEQLIGKGDMLISRDGVIDRVQCAFIDTDEVERMTHAIADQMGYPTPYELPDVAPAETVSGNALASGDRDALFNEAGRAIIESQTASTSFLQRKFNIGYPRAGKIMDQLEAAGVIGPPSGMKPRAILMDLYSFELYLNQ